MSERLTSEMDTADMVGEMPKHKFTMVCVSKGLEFGHGAISGEDEPEVLAIVDEIINSSGDILVPVDYDDDGRPLEDDGCGDGREAKVTFRMGQIYKRSLNRAKVFGGSVAMTAAALIGLGERREESLNPLFSSAIKKLLSKGIEFGGHTDEHAHGTNCGCGAIDQAPTALLAALKYEYSIEQVIRALGVSAEGLDEVQANYRSYVKAFANDPRYSGRLVMDQIYASGKVIKELGGEHRERRIILNSVRGYTTNQKLIRDATQGKAQAFAVDIWRLEDIATRLYPDDPVKSHKAFLSELVYTLAVSAVLTKGDLPVYLTQTQPAQPQL